MSGCATCGTAVPYGQTHCLKHAEAWRKVLLRERRKLERQQRLRRARDGAEAGDAAA